MSGQNINKNDQLNVEDQLKYYYDNDSENVEYEDLDAFTICRGREENELHNNEFNVDNNNSANNFANNINVSSNNNVISANINNLISINSNVEVIGNSRPNNNINFLNNNNNEVNIVNQNNNNFLDSSGLENYSSEFNGNDDFSENNNNHNNNRNFEAQIDDIFEQLTYAITTEKHNLKNEKTNFIKEKNKFNELKKNEKLKLEKEKDIWRENNRIIENLNIKETDILDLDIGGTQKITTTRSTLLKYPTSALATMFSGRHKLHKHNERYFIDRDGNTFLNLVNFLRSGKFPVFKNKLEEISFFEELEFWQINYRQNNINFQFDPEWYASTLILDNNNTIIRKKSLQHGIVFLKNPFDVYNNYIEFKVIMHIPSRGKNHLFVGVVDKSKYKYENLISTFWKDSPSSFYWDVWNTKLIKTDENGIQVGSIGSYGCQCEENETRIGMLYDHKNKTLSFYKNSINQGVAFKNVPSGLTPSLDLWFESGSVEIIKRNAPEEKIFL